MAPGSFECLLQTGGSDHTKQQEDDQRGYNYESLVAFSISLSLCLCLCLCLLGSFTVSSL